MPNSFPNNKVKKGAKVPSDPVPQKCEQCGVTFTPENKRGWWLRRYCDEHMVGDTSGTIKPHQKKEDHRCDFCGKLMPLTAHPLKKYCSKTCSVKQHNLTAREREKQRAAELQIEDVGSARQKRRRKGPIYHKLKERPLLADAIIRREKTLEQAANELDCTISGVSRAMNTIRFELEAAKVTGTWQPHPYVQAMLPVGALRRIMELGPEGEGTEEFDDLLDSLVRAYSVFSRRFFQLEGKRPFVEEFHLKWIRSIIVSMAIGGKQMILSPPRHGKSELLIRFCVWLIAMESNIRIMWVAANGDVSKLMIGAVKDHLENNEELTRSVLPPGESFRPDRNMARPWSAKEIKVKQQSHVGQKSSSMLALGRTAKILSRDVDLLITDDLEDFDTTREPAQRQYSRNKLAEIGTRKEERTAWVYIASRQHPDDIPQHIMQLEGTPQAWRTIVDSAHIECQLDPDEIPGHDENGCVLFPKVRSYRWLMEKQAEMDALGIPGAFEMRYLNKPVPETGIVFDIKLIREQALDRSRDLGTAGLGAGRLLAGLDPAARGTQAAFGWHYANGALAMVDLETQEAGGFEGAHSIMERWFDLYGLTEWYYEDNSQQVEFFNDPRTKRLAADLGLTIRTHSTGRNKQDPELGISSMAPWYHDGRISLPYGTALARGKVNQLLRQLELWTTDGIARGKNAKTDIKMASWFPFPTIIKLGRQDNKVRLVQGPEMSYPQLDSFNTTPWQTNYPGGR